MPPKKKFVLVVPKELETPSNNYDDSNKLSTRGPTKRGRKKKAPGNSARTKTSNHQQNNKNNEIPSDDDPEITEIDMPAVKKIKKSNQNKQQIDITSTNIRDSESVETASSDDISTNLSCVNQNEQQADINSTNTVISNQKQFNIDKNNMKSSDENFSVTGQTCSDNEDETNIPLSGQQPKFPSQFHNMTNEFEIALWLAYHQRILNLAISIRNGMSTKVNEEECETSLTSNLSHEAVLQSGSSLPEIDQYIKFQLQEECKALFLRTRNNTVALYEELVVRVCKITKTDPRLGTLVKDVVEPYNELDEFITEDVWRQLFQMHLRVTDQQKLKKDSEIITNLGIFVRHVVKAILIAQRDKEDTQAVVKKCDENTIDLPIPTKLGIVK
ncbi:2317_t:CDS:2, partial [Rhizophagus irregularis]